MKLNPKQKLAQAVQQAVRTNIDKPYKVIHVALDFLTSLLSNKYDHWLARFQDLELIERLSQRFSMLAEFIETYTLDPVYNNDPSPQSVDDAVTIITIHSAKGTKSPICMVPQMVPGVYPHRRSLGNDDDIEEERRVLYVALTRAENELILTRAGSPGQTTVFGGSGLGDRDHVNYFFSDVPMDLVESSFIEGADHSTFLDGLKEFEME